MIKVVLDTNVLISAVVFGGKPRQVLEAAIKGHFLLVLTKDIIEEMRGVLVGNKFQYPEEMADLITKDLEALAEIATPKKGIKIIEKGSEDNRVLECARQAQADYIVSGDTHLLEIKEFQGTKILTSREFLGLLDE